LFIYNYTLALGKKSKPIKDSIIDVLPAKGLPITFIVGSGIS